MMTDMEDFFVVHTKPNQENKAKKNLEFQGFKTWLPIYKKAVVRKNRLFLREEPFFPGYIFVFFDISKDNWSRIFSTLGVKYLITFDGKPKAVEKKTMVGLKKIINNECLNINDNVKILSGKLYSKSGKIVEICSSDRVKLLLESLSGKFTAILQKNILYKI